MTKEELVHRLRTGIFPHTGKNYDCAHCEWEPDEPPPIKGDIRASLDGVNGSYKSYRVYVKKGTER